MVKFDAIPHAGRGQLKKSLRDVERRIENGGVHSLILIGLLTDGSTISLCGSGYNSETGLMLREFIEHHFKCACGDPNCATDLTRMSIIGILDAYVDGDEKPVPKGN